MVWEFIVKKKQGFGVIILVILFFFVMIPAFNKSIKKRNLEIFSKGIYGIAQVTEYRSETRSSHYRYRFTYKGKTYRARYYYNRNHNPEVGKRYFVIIAPERKWFANNSLLLADFPVPDSIKEAPPEGWKECPGVSREQIREFLDHY